MVNESVGVYWLYYRVLDTAVKEGLVFTFTAVCNTKTIVIKASSEVGDAREIDTKVTYISEELEIDRTFGSAEAGSDASHLVCTTLTRPSGDYVNWHLVMLSGVNAGLMRRANAWSLVTTTLTLNNAFPGAIAAGDSFDLISINTSANRFIGQNDIANEVDTTLITADRDGSLLERAEDIRDLVDKRILGRRQVIQTSVTAAANAGNTTLATVMTQPCLIESVSIRAKSAAPADMTTCAMNAGTANIVHLIVVGLATQANLNTIDKQVGSTNLAELPVGSTIVMDLQGTGATAVDLIVTIAYYACADGGYINPV